MMENIIHKTLDDERALYHLKNTSVEECTVAGPFDGESVLKECDHIEVKKCRF